MRAKFWVRFEGFSDVFAIFDFGIVVLYMVLVKGCLCTCP